MLTADAYVLAKKLNNNNNIKNSNIEILLLYNSVYWLFLSSK